MGAKIVTSEKQKEDLVIVTKIFKNGYCQYNLKGQLCSDYVAIPTMKQKLLERFQEMPDYYNIVWPLPKGYIKSLVKQPLFTTVKSDAELKQIAMDLYEGKIFCDRHIERVEDLTMVFMIIALGGFANHTEKELKEIGLIYEYLSEAGPGSVDGLPSFLSMRLLSIPETEKMFKHYEEYKDLKKQFMTDPQSKVTVYQYKDGRYLSVRPTGDGGNYPRLHTNIKEATTFNDVELTEWPLNQIIEEGEEYFNESFELKVEDFVQVKIEA